MNFLDKNNNCQSFCNYHKLTKYMVMFVSIFITCKYLELDYHRSFIISFIGAISFCINDSIL